MDALNNLEHGTFRLNHLVFENIKNIGMCKKAFKVLPVSQPCLTECLIALNVNSWFEPWALPVKNEFVVKINKKKHENQKVVYHGLGLHGCFCKEFTNLY